MTRTVTVSLTYGVLIHASTTKVFGCARVDQTAAQAVRRIHRQRFALILSTNVRGRLGLRAAGISTLFKARIESHEDRPAEFFRALVSVAECPPERIIHVDSDRDRVSLALEEGMRGVHFHPHSEPDRPLPPGAAHAGNLAELPDLLIQLLRTPTLT